MLSKNNLALICTGVLLFGFFISGIFDILDYIIVKLLLFTGFALLGFILIWIAVKESDTK
ncbi:hypothetical protein [Psychroserpens ponticola]|uniref:Uncharacterized protein n=1 Tax=Psychroserpens ponticola TaxID=2932268 RepID=A0ABY7RV07_9FLAO|nr:hypothetical protein [Psychroserpens ponticola]WCO00602.1 hypothetical protein MUN68_011050 [Psychroserpens ponticola]